MVEITKNGVFIDGSFIRKETIESWYREDPYLADEFLAKHKIDFSLLGKMNEYEISTRLVCQGNASTSQE